MNKRIIEVQITLSVAVDESVAEAFDAGKEFVVDMPLDTIKFLDGEKQIEAQFSMSE